eukprot:6474275-Amphidinium_carterae.1
MKPTPISTPIQATMVSRADETHRVVRKVHITQLSSSKVQPQLYEPTKKRNHVVILELHHDEASYLLQEQITTNPRSAWTLWLRGKGVSEKALPELGASRTSTHKGRTITSTPAYVAEEHMTETLQHSGKDGVYLR